MAIQVKCVVVDDHPAVRRGLALLLADSDDIDLVCSVDSAEAAVEAVAEHQPDMLVVDLRLPGMDGISLVRRLAEQTPRMKTVVYSAYGDRGLLCDAIGAGVRGYVMKGSPPEDLIRAIRTVAAGEAFV
nr:response regulator transcription factor [Thermoleophilaceae bacterium]